MPSSETLTHIPLPIEQRAQAGTPLYNWVYSGSGENNATFRVECEGSRSSGYAGVTSVIITLGSFTVNAQAFFQYYYQIGYVSQTASTPSLYVEGLVPADKLSRFVAENLTFQAVGSGPISLSVAPKNR